MKSGPECSAAVHAHSPAECWEWRVAGDEDWRERGRTCVTGRDETTRREILVKEYVARRERARTDIEIMRSGRMREKWKRQLGGQRQTRESKAGARECRVKFRPIRGGR